MLPTRVSRPEGSTRTQIWVVTTDPDDRMAWRIDGEESGTAELVGWDDTQVAAILTGEAGTGPACLIEHSETGLLAPPDVNALADALGSITGTPLLSERISRAALAAVRGRSWEAALDRLAAAYRIALSAHGDQSLARGVA